MTRTCLLVLSLTAAACLAAGEASAAQLTASWTDNSGGEATTRLERRPRNVVAFAAIAEVPPGVTAYVDASVSAGTTYCYRIAAYDDAGASPYSAEACATPGDDGSSLDLAVRKVGVGTGTIASTPGGHPVRHHLLRDVLGQHDRDPDREAGRWFHLHRLERSSARRAVVSPPCCSVLPDCCGRRRARCCSRGARSRDRRKA